MFHALLAIGVPASSYSVRNVAPWITTVGAGTIDRDFPALVILSNGQNYTGAWLFKGDALPPKLLSFVYAGNASNNDTEYLCYLETLIPEKVKGKIAHQRGGSESCWWTRNDFGEYGG